MVLLAPPSCARMTAKAFAPLKDIALRAVRARHPNYTPGCTEARHVRLGARRHRVTSRAALSFNYSADPSRSRRGVADLCDKAQSSDSAAHFPQASGLRSSWPRGQGFAPPTCARTISKSALQRQEIVRHGPVKKWGGGDMCTGRTGPEVPPAARLATWATRAASEMPCVKRESNARKTPMEGTVTREPSGQDLWESYATNASFHAACSDPIYRPSHSLMGPCTTLILFITSRLLRQPTKANNQSSKQAKRASADTFPVEPPSPPCHIC